MKYLTQPSAASNAMDLTMGLFDGWWVGIEDDRPDRAPVNVETWDSKLRQSGFDGIETAVFDNKHPESFLSANIISRPTVKKSEIKGHIVAPRL
jgi:hypothetical protein